MALIALHEEIDADYSRYMPIHVLDKAAIGHAKRIFNDYAKRGVIIRGTFEDMSWTLTNETKNVGLTLLTFEGGTKKKAMSWIGCTYRQYVLCVKAYILFNLGNFTLSTLQELCRQFNRLAAATDEEAVAMIEYAPYIVALLLLIPNGNERRDAVIEELEEIIERQKGFKCEGNQRKLADFTSYLRFHDVMVSFWQNADEPRRLFYFPLYFWWNLTAILPLRPMEFLLTPQKCLRFRDGEYLLTVRRTKLKSGRERISYHIADDYELKEYTIHEPLAAEIRWYIKMVYAERPVHAARLDTLLAQEPHYSYMGIPRNTSSRYYTYACLCTCLRYFYDEVIEPGGHDIARIRLGDTRHLAMTNLILSGGSPVICRELAGHANIETSAHYYSNVANLVECITLQRFRKTKSTEAVMHGASKYPISAPANTSKVDGGRCKSELLKKGLIDDCLKAADINGNIGDCRFCGYFLPDNPGIIIGFYDEKAAKRQVDMDCRYLIRMIELVRKGIGQTEDIGAALLRLQLSGSHYSKCLTERLMEEDKEPWQDQES